MQLCPNGTNGSTDITWHRTSNTFPCLIFSHSSSVGIATRILIGRSGVRILAEGKMFLFPKTSRQALEAHPTSYTIGTEILSRGLKLTTHLYLDPRLKNKWCYTSSLPIRLHGVHRLNFNIFRLFFKYLPYPVSFYVFLQEPFLTKRIKNLLALHCKL
jgi:hypothetical protein